MKAAKLFKFSALMFYAVAFYLFLTAMMQAESRFLFLALAVISIIVGVLMSAKTNQAKDK